MNKYQARGHIVGIRWTDPDDPFLPTGFVVELDDTGINVPVENLTIEQRKAIKASPAECMVKYVQLVSDTEFSEDMPVDSVRFDYFI